MAEETKLEECRTCGAAVINSERHTAWHNAQPGETKRAMQQDQRLQNALEY